MTETPTGPGVYCILLVLEEPLGFSCFELTGTHTHTHNFFKAVFDTVCDWPCYVSKLWLMDCEL